MINGVYISYYFHCKRKLWLFARNIKMEQNSEDVFIGKIISMYSFDRKKHEIHISDEEEWIAIDFIDKSRKIVHEIKKSDKFEEANIWQVKYYLYILEKKGLSGFTGIINHPKQRKTSKVELNHEDRVILENVIRDINVILNSEKPPPVINKPFCKKCSYYEFCYS
ncbi:MAG: CRISPR-associated protein Cas4 [Candidatus Aenigmatarchaeota archaeon]